jgi:PPOX class probable F420-dependent enzyme
MATLSPHQVQLLKEPNVGVLATIRPDGTPHATPIWVDWDGEHVIFNTAVGRAKERHMRRDPRVCVEVHDRDDPQVYVSITGRAELVEDGADDVIKDLALKYEGKREFDNRGRTRVTVRVRPERVEEHRPDPPSAS